MPDAPNIPEATPILKRELDEALALAKSDPLIGPGAMVQITATAIDCGSKGVLHVIERSVGKIDEAHSSRWGITCLRELGRGPTWLDALRNAKPARHDYGKGRRGGP